MASKPPEAPANPAVRYPLAERARLHTHVPVAASAVGVGALPDAALPAVKSRNNWVLYAFVFFLPLQNLQVGYMPNLGAGLNFLNLFFGLSLIGAWKVGGSLGKGEALNRWVLIYAIYQVISLLIGYRFVSSPEVHVNLLKDQLLGLFVFYLVQMSVVDWTAWRRILLATVLPLPYIGRVLWAQHQSVAEWHYSDDLRIKGTFTLLGANEMAAFCVTSVIILFALLLGAKMSRMWRWGLLAGLAFMVMGVMYGYSRTAYVTLILGVLTVALVWRQRMRLILPLLITAALLPAIVPSSVMERFEETKVEEGQRDESTEMRFEFWAIAWDTFTHYPIAGTGYHTFHHREINPWGKDTHNLYMRTLSEGGLIGAVILLGILFSVLLTVLRHLKISATGTMPYALGVGLVGVWVAWIVGNLFGDRFTYYPMIAYLWVYVALLIKARDLPKEGAKP